MNKSQELIKRARISRIQAHDTLARLRRRLVEHTKMMNDIVDSKISLKIDFTQSKKHV